MEKTKTINSFLKRKGDEQESKRRKGSTCESQVHDESSISRSLGNNFEPLELINEVAEGILANAPYHSKYTFEDVEKELYSIVANKVRKHIRSEVGDSYFCVMVDESRDVLKKEQMAVVLRFVDAEGIIRERFLDVVPVKDFLPLTLKISMWKQLSLYQFNVSKIRGQGYDGASDIRGKWNELQELVLQYCPYAYNVHCFAHRLQLALVAASREIIPVHQFFTNLVFTINVVCGSSKHYDELQKARADELKKLLELGEITSGKGPDQVGTLRKVGDTRWGSYFNSICSLLKMFAVTRVVLMGIIEDKSATFSQRGDADLAYVHLTSFEFVFILHLIKEVMGKIDALSQAIQKKSQDILNVMKLVSSTKASLNDFRNTGWDSFLVQVTYFCDKYLIEMPDMLAPYTSTRYCLRRKDLHITFEHYYRVDLFTSTLDKQIHELNSRFDEHAVELLSLSSSLVSKEINVDQICLLVEKYYPEDFTQQERTQLRYQLETFNIDMTNNTGLSGVSTIADLCKSLVETQKHETYYLLDRVVRLILTLPVIPATTKRGSSAMKIFKNRIRKKISDEFLANSLVFNIEKEIAKNFDPKSIIDEFKDLKGRRPSYNSSPRF